MPEATPPIGQMIASAVHAGVTRAVFKTERHQGGPRPASTPQRTPPAFG